MSHAVAVTSLDTLIVSMAGRRRQRSPKPKPKQSQGSAAIAGGGGGTGEQLWRCVEGCGACCKLNKGPSFATPEQLFTQPSDIQVSSLTHHSHSIHINVIIHMF